MKKPRQKYIQIIQISFPHAKKEGKHTPLACWVSGFPELNMRLNMEMFRPKKAEANSWYKGFFRFFADSIWSGAMVQFQFFSRLFSCFWGGEGSFPSHFGNTHSSRTTPAKPWTFGDDDDFLFLERWTVVMTLFHGPFHGSVWVLWGSLISGQFCCLSYNEMFWTEKSAGLSWDAAMASDSSSGRESMPRHCATLGQCDMTYHHSPDITVNGKHSKLHDYMYYI